MITCNRYILMLYFFLHVVSYLFLFWILAFKHTTVCLGGFEGSKNQVEWIYLIEVAYITSLGVGGCGLVMPAIHRTHATLKIRSFYCPLNITWYKVFCQCRSFYYHPAALSLIKKIIYISIIIFVEAQHRAYTAQCNNRIQDLLFLAKLILLSLT